MKITKKNLSLKNIKSYIQANKRILVENYGPGFLQSPWWVQEQIVWRPEIADPKCIEKGECIVCECLVPDKFYSDAECEGGCYHEIMDESTCIRFKKIKEVNNLDPRIWKEVLQIIEDTKPREIITMKDYGKIKKNVVHHATYPLQNDFNSDMDINTIGTSCACVKVEGHPNKIKSKSKHTVNISINTSKKSIGTHRVYITVRYNNIKRIRFELVFEVIE